MSTQDNNPKVVDFSQRTAVPGERPDRAAGEMLGQVRAHATKRVIGLVTTLFENADDTLFDLASKAESNAAQASFFDGMREVRKQRQSIETKFQERFSRQFSDFQTGRAPAGGGRPDGGSAPAPGELSLSLLDDSELEESLAVGSMVAKAENRLQRPLFALNQRLAHLANARVEDASNPIGPAIIAQTFREAMANAETTLEVKLVVYKLFDRFVLGGLDALYDELNALMIHAGVLPQLRGVVVQRQTAAPARTGGAGLPAGAELPAGAAPMTAPGAGLGAAPMAGGAGAAYDPVADAGALPAARRQELVPMRAAIVDLGGRLARRLQGERAFTATLRVPAAWLQAQPAAPAAAPPGSASALQAAFAGRPQALAGGLFALVLQPTALAGDAHGGASVAGHTSALLALELAPWAGAAASLVYGREQLQARHDPWLQMLALQASGYGRDEEEAEQRRRARGHCDTPGCPYAGRAPCEQPFCHALWVEPVPPIDRA